MSMRIKVKFTNNLKKSDDEILEALASAVPDLIATDIYPVSGGAMVVLDNINHVEQLLLDSTQKALQKYFIRIPTPPWYMADRTIFLPKARQLYTRREPDDLLLEINHHNSFKAKAITIIKPKYNQSNSRPTIKIIMNSSQDVDEALANGIRMDHSIIKPEWIQRERVINVQQCFICFKFNHLASQCSRKQCLCSICGGDHHFKNCMNPDRPTCINCKGDHAAISNNCPEKIKASEEYERKTMSAQPQIPSQSRPCHSTILDINSQEQFPAWQAVKPNPTQFTIPSSLPTSSDPNITMNKQPKANTKNQLPQQPPNLYPSNIFNSQNETSAEQIQSNNEWSIRLQIMDKYADMIVDKNPRAGVYLDVMNHYLVNNNMKPLKPYHSTDNKEDLSKSSSSTHEEEVEMPFSLSTPPSLPPSPNSYQHNNNPSTPMVPSQTNSSTPIIAPQNNMLNSTPIPIPSLENDCSTKDTVKSPESVHSNCDSVATCESVDSTTESTSGEGSDSEINQTVVSIPTSNSPTQSSPDSGLITPYQHHSDSTKKTMKRKEKYRNLTLSDRVLRSGADSEAEAELIRNTVSGSIQSTISSIIDNELNNKDLS